MTPHLLLPCCITELARLGSYENLSKTDIVFTSSMMEEVRPL